MAVVNAPAEATEVIVVIRPVCLSPRTTIAVAMRKARAAVQTEPCSSRQAGRGKTSTLHGSVACTEHHSCRLTRNDFFLPDAHLVVNESVLLHVVAVLDKLRTHLLEHIVVDSRLRRLRILAVGH